MAVRDDKQTGASATTTTRRLFRGVQRLFSSHEQRLIFAPSHSASFASQVAVSLGLELAQSEEREYERGEHKMRPTQDVRGRDVFVVESLCGDERASVNDKLCRLLFFIGALKDAGAARVTACLPYLAYARKDRRTQPFDPVITRSVAAMFEAVRVDRVMALDVHNESAFDNAFRCQSIRMDATATFADYYTQTGDRSKLVVASPDAGGFKRAQVLRDRFAEKLGRPVEFAFMEKRRAAGVVSGDVFTGAVAERDVLIFDDMIASGTTLLRATAAAKRAGARRVDVIATHAAFTPEAARLFEPGGPDAVIVSDSVALPQSFAPWLSRSLHVVRIAPLIAASIRQLEPPR
jgi:ribose-phosphate pyrophosphokinase